VRARPTSVSSVFFRDAMRRPPVAVRGEGIYLFDSGGKRYVDASGGAAVSCLGHNHPDIQSAIVQQLSKLEYAHTGFFSNEPQEELAANLVMSAPKSLGHAFFVTGGSEAIEAALKLARQYHCERGEPKRTRIISREFSYHGNTLGALAASGNYARRKIYEPLLIDVPRVAACFAYRGIRTGETPKAYGVRVAQELEDRIVELGPETVAAFVAETVVGATLGAVAAVEGYFERIREICNRYGVLLILDEVMSGMGRTGTLHAFEQEGIIPDILVIAKGLGAGYQAIGGLLIDNAIYSAIAGGSGAFVHGHTYMGHPIACAAALAVQQVMQRDDLVAAVAEQGAKLGRMLGAQFEDHWAVGDIRGRGLFWAVELVADRSTKAPFASSLRLNARIKERAMAYGLLCYPGGGTFDGVAGDHVLLAPPFNVTEEELANVVSLLTESLNSVLAEIAR
jgi:adenosylmethionine-8-amino-7-oxononanoate aminotransferase